MASAAILQGNDAILALFARKRLLSLAVPAAILVYLAYVAIAFDVAGLSQRARMDNAAILLADTVSHKVHVTRDNRSGQIEASIEGSRRMIYAPEQRPDWVRIGEGSAIITLGQGHVVTYDGPEIRYQIPGFEPIRITIGEAIVLDRPSGDLPAVISASDSRVSVTTAAGRLSVTRSRTETMRYFAGWEVFFFDLQSPFWGRSWPEIAGLVTTGARLDPAQSNLSLMLSNVWRNAVWRHGEVVWAIGETILMAFLGTFGAALIALPLAFLAAGNFAPSRLVRFVMRRIFDFVRGVDALIFTIILSRAFGPGPLTGALAILVTDTGSFGKMFSEVLENVDGKQIEGIRSTGANSVQNYRFGVIPQVMPVLLSQVLYLFESNTRSATVIGAIVGGGIGLMLTQAIQTTQDWEKVSYYIILIVLMVIAMDALSGWLRRKLIKGE